MARTMMVLAALLLRDESALRETFTKEIKAKESAKRVDAVKKLAGSKEEKTLALLAQSLKDADKGVRKAAAESLESCTDGGGVAIQPLGECLIDKKEDPEVRMACAKALSKAHYRAEPLRYLIKTISEIEREDVHLHKFGADVTKILDGVAGKSFDAKKETPERWNEWWMDNEEKLRKEDAKKLEEYKKAQK